MKTGNCVIEFILETLIAIQQVGIWCVDKILKYPILTAIFLIVILILAIINRTIETEIRGNLWKWRR